MALWAFILGYVLSSIIQVFVTRERMQRAMGRADAKSIGLGTFFGFVSSSCSFSALATTKALFSKGASFMASMAFLLASTNLVIELGILISVFLGWQFLVGEYVGGILLILITWLLVAIIRPDNLIKEVRSRLEERSSGAGETKPLKERLRSKEEWTKVGHQYVMEWQMVWKDVTIGFTLAGIVAVFVPDSFFRTLFINSGPEVTQYSFPVLLEHVVVGPVAAFLTFIGSMGNIPLAALLFGKGVSFAGVMAFIFSDLVVLPVLRINARYYGWKMSLFILFLLFVALIITSLSLHYGLSLFDMLPDVGTSLKPDSEHFKWNYTTFMNFGFLLISGYLLLLNRKHSGHHGHAMAKKGKVLERILLVLAWISYLWLLIGMLLYLTG